MFTDNFATLKEFQVDITADHVQIIFAYFMCVHVYESRIKNILPRDYMFVIGFER